MNYTLHQLHVFTKVVQNQSVSKAAEELHMTQPAVSIQLKNFQQQFDIPLTEVIGRKLHITEFGEEVYRMAERVLNEVNAINHRTLAYQGLLAGTLKVSSASTGKYLIPFFLADFIHSHPGIDLTLDVTNKTMVIHSLLRNEIDFAFVSTIPDGLDVEEEILVDNSLFLIGAGRREHENPSGSSEPLSHTMIFREQGSATRKAMEDWASQQGLVMRRKMEMTSNEAVKQAVLANLGYSVMPLLGIKNQLQSGELQIIPTKGLPIHTKWRLIWLRNKTLTPIAKKYLEFLRKEKSKIIAEHFEWILEYSRPTQEVQA